VPDRKHQAHQQREPIGLPMAFGLNLFWAVASLPSWTRPEKMATRHDRVAWRAQRAAWVDVGQDRLLIFYCLQSDDLTAFRSVDDKIRVTADTEGIYR
jgi:hypothetical protein